MLVETFCKNIVKTFGFWFLTIFNTTCKKMRCYVKKCLQFGFILPNSEATWRQSQENINSYKSSIDFYDNNYMPHR